MRSCGGAWAERKLPMRKVHGMEKVRQKMNKLADGCREVHWADVLRKSRDRVHRSTAKRSFARAGLDVAWRRPREKPQRSAEHERA